MNIKRSSIFFLLIVVFLLPNFASVAQDETHPLLEMLAMVPDNELSRDTWIRYQDFRAVEDARESDA